MWMLTESWLTSTTLLHEAVEPMDCWIWAVMSPSVDVSSKVTLTSPLVAVAVAVSAQTAATEARMGRRVVDSCILIFGRSVWWVWDCCNEFERMLMR